MNKLFVRFGGAIASFALIMTAFSANATCACIAYQPELPEGAKKFRKF